MIEKGAFRDRRSAPARPHAVHNKEAQRIPRGLRPEWTALRRYRTVWSPGPSTAEGLRVGFWALRLATLGPPWDRKMRVGLGWDL